MKIENKIEKTFNEYLKDNEIDQFDIENRHICDFTQQNETLTGFYCTEIQKELDYYVTASTGKNKGGIYIETTFNFDALLLDTYTKEEALDEIMNLREQALKITKETTTKLMIAIEYITEPTYEEIMNQPRTFEIFETIANAYKFYQENKENVTEIFIADFLKNSIYQEEEGNWNYKDHSALYGYKTLIKFE